MNSHLALTTSDNCLAYMDVGKVREQERKLRLVLECIKHNLFRPDLIRGS